MLMAPNLIGPHLYCVLNIYKKNNLKLKTLTIERRQQQQLQQKSNNKLTNKYLKTKPKKCSLTIFMKLKLFCFMFDCGYVFISLVFHFFLIPFPSIFFFFSLLNIWVDNIRIFFFLSFNFYTLDLAHSVFGI